MIHRFRRSGALALAALGFSSMSFAAMIERAVDYPIEGRMHRGYLIYDDSVSSPRPLLLMVPNWLGTTAANRRQAADIAGRDYVLFVADMYGKDAQPADSAAAGTKVQALYADRPELRKRARAGLTRAIAQARDEKLATPPGPPAAIGFCFGGASVLELARSGAELAAVVSFHGNLSLPPGKEQDAPITAPVLALHGDADPYVPSAQVDAFVTEMRGRNADWQLVRFGGAVHSFTDPDANTPGKAMYDAKAAHRAFSMMRDLLAEVYARR